MTFKIYHDCDARFRLRKVVVECYAPTGCLLDRRRMFAGPFFMLRLNIKMHMMTRLGKKMWALTSH